MKDNRKSHLIRLNEIKNDINLFTDELISFSEKLIPLKHICYLDFSSIIDKMETIKMNTDSCLLDLHAYCSRIKSINMIDSHIKVDKVVELCSILSNHRSSIVNNQYTEYFDLISNTMDKNIDQTNIHIYFVQKRIIHNMFMLLKSIEISLDFDINFLNLYDVFEVIKSHPNTSGAWM